MATTARDELTVSATELSRRVRLGEITSRALVDAHIAQIERVNPLLNAVVAERYADARSEADAADALVAATDDPSTLPPFHGVPCTVKETFQLAGMPNTAGLLARRDMVAETDATTVARLRAAGAIPLGVSNTSELAMWIESNNPVYGRSNNPYDLRCTVGGSSGGEGAIIGAGGSPFGVGSDIGGSIRLPAFFNGVFGHKCTGGLVPNTGQYPLPENAALRFQCTGPITRRAEDLMPLLRLMAGPDGKDAGTFAMPLGDPATVDIAALRVLSIEGNGMNKVSPELLRAQRQVVAALGDRGATLVPTTRLPALRRSFEIWAALMSEARMTPFRVLLGDGVAPRNRDLVRNLATRSPHTVPAASLALLEQAAERLPGRVRSMVERGRALRQELVDLIGPDGVLLFPSFPVTAPRHGRALVLPFQWSYTGILNVLEVPATQVPLGLDRAGKPLGVQVVAVHGNDHVTIAVAEELERVFGGWTPPRWVGLSSP